LKATALYDFRGEGPDELVEFRMGDTILVTARPFEMWWEGEIQVGPFKGMRGESRDLFH
jgi:hypothetical protein